MGLISTDYKKEISLNEKEAELLYCPFKNEVLCDTIRCMSWVKIVNIHSSVDNMCPKGYVDLSQDEYQKLYGNTPSFLNTTYYFKKEDDKPSGYCLRLNGCLQC